MFKDLPTIMLGKLQNNHSGEEKVPGTQRQIGENSTTRDLRNVIFSSSNKFNHNETVLVTRSSGGFTYGEIATSKTISCLATNKECAHPGM